MNNDDKKMIEPLVKLSKLMFDLGKESKDKDSKISERYIEQNGEKCPVCQSGNTDYYSPDFYDDPWEMWRDMECLDCEATWTEVYKMDRIIEVTNNEEE